MTCEAQDSPGYKLTLPVSSKPAPARAPVALIAAGLGRSGSPQLASINRIANENAEYPNNFISVYWVERHAPRQIFLRSK